MMKIGCLPLLIQLRSHPPPQMKDEEHPLQSPQGSGVLRTLPGLPGQAMLHQGFSYETSAIMPPCILMRA